MAPSVHASLRAIHTDDVPDPPELDYPRPGTYNILKGVKCLGIMGLGLWQVAEWESCIRRGACTAAGWWPGRNLPLIILLGLNCVWRILFVVYFLSVADCSDADVKEVVVDDVKDVDCENPTAVRLPRTSYIYLREPLNQLLAIMIAFVVFVGSLTLTLWLGTTEWQRTYFWTTVTLAVAALLLQALSFLVTLMDSQWEGFIYYVCFLYYGLARSRLYVWVAQWVLVVLYLVHFASCRNPGYREASLDARQTTGTCAVTLMPLMLSVLFVLFELGFYVYSLWYCFSRLPRMNPQQPTKDNTVYFPAFGSLGQWESVAVRRVQKRGAGMLVVLIPGVLLVPALYLTSPPAWYTASLVYYLYIIMLLFGVLAIYWMCLSRAHELLRRKRKRKSKKSRSKRAESAILSLAGYVRAKHRWGARFRAHLVKYGGHNQTLTYSSVRLSKKSVDAGKAAYEAMIEPEMTEYDSRGQPKPIIDGVSTSRQVIYAGTTEDDRRHPPPLPPLPPAEAPPAAVPMERAPTPGDDNEDDETVPLV